jgi:arylsulfatase A-like enzyme
MFDRVLSRSLQLFLALGLLGFGHWTTAAAAETSSLGKPPNVVLIIADDMAWTDYGFMGHPQIKTPNLDRLASQGLTFRRGYVPCSLCRPSLVSMLTGLFPHQHKITSNDPPLPKGVRNPDRERNEKFLADRERTIAHIDRAPTLPKTLGELGYVSFQTGKWWEGNFRRGGFTDGMSLGGRHGDKGLDIGRVTMQPMFDFIDRAAADGKPFFVWYAPMLPHTPHNPPERLLAKYESVAPTPQIAKYWAMCEWFDETCGQLLDRLDEKKLSENTIVLYVADNGWIQNPNGQQYAAKSKQSPYDGGLRTPIMLRWPGKIKPQMSDALAESIDFAPTILAAAGLKPTAEMQGINLLDAKQVAARQTLFGECFQHNNVDIDRPATSLRWRWCVDGDWKLIVPQPSEGGSVELYDLKKDPHETVNLADANSEVVARLKQKLDAWWPGRDSEPKPNVVLIFTDDQGYGDLGCYGATDIKTPNVDRLATEGTRFTSFYVAQPVCTASRTALLTGCYPNRLGMAGALNHTSTVGIHPREKLLSDLAKSQGYATAVYGKWHLGQQPPFLPTRRGFDEFFGLPYSNDNGPLHPVVKGIPPLPLYEGESIVSTDPDQSQFTRMLTDRAVSFIERNQDRPFFLYVPHIMPHVPIFASEKFRGTSQRGLYGDVIQELDSSVGEIMAALRRHGLDERTLVIYATDNGPFLSYGEHAGSAGRLREGKLTTFEGGVRVPFITRWPGHVPSDRVCDELFASMDLFASLARLMGAQLPQAKIDGLDLRPLLLGEADAKGRDVFWYYSGDELHAVRQGDWKLHLPHEYLTVAAEPGRGGKPSNYGKLEPKSIELSGIRGIATRHGYRFEPIGLSLYNLKTDPGETTNGADKHPEIVAQLQAIAAAARTDLGDSLTKVVGANVRPSGNARP